MQVEKRRLLTIEDLFKFCQENKMYQFSSADNGYKLSVQVPSTFEVEDDIDDAHRGMLKLKFRIFHTGLNRNGSFVSEEAAKDAMPTIKNRPILAAIHQLDSGEWDFESHNFEIVKNDDGTEEIVYIEKQVGSFDESDPFFEYDEKLDKTYVCSYAYISEDYTKACDILRKKNGAKNSCELNIDELSFNAKEGYLSLDKFYVAASTLLGRTKTGEEIGEGMLGSRADIVDFSEANNANQFDSNKELLNEIKKLNENLSHFNINQADDSASENLKKGGTETVKFNELLEKYGKTVDDITFEYENLSDEELEAKFAEAFEETDTDGEGEVTDVEVLSSDDGEDDHGDETGEQDEIEEDSKEEIEGNIEEFSEKFVKTYEISHDDIRYALYNLLSTQEDVDNEWYFINAVYDNHFTYENWMGDKIYGQAYTKDNDNVAFDGERWNLHRELLTDSEYAELMAMRSNYASVVEELSKYKRFEERAQKEEIIYHQKYSVIAAKDEDGNYKNADFAKLVSEIDNYSLTDIEKEVKTIFADHITNGGCFENSTKESNASVSKKLFASTKGKKQGRYGNLFANKTN